MRIVIFESTNLLSLSLVTACFFLLHIPVIPGAVLILQMFGKPFALQGNCNPLFSFSVSPHSVSMACGLMVWNYHHGMCFGSCLLEEMIYDIREQCPNWRCLLKRSILCLSKDESHITTPELFIKIIRI